MSGFSRTAIANIARQADYDTWPVRHMLNRILTVICSLTVLATSYLTVSVIVLRPPRFNYQAWAVVLGSLVTLQGALTLLRVLQSDDIRRIVA